MKRLSVLALCILTAFTLISCGKSTNVKIGVAFGVGPATRWAQEIDYMTQYAEELGVELETRLNKDEAQKPFEEDCIELIDSGVSSLIIRPRDVYGMQNVVDYAKKKNVKIISYDSLIEDSAIDLFIGYDSEQTGQILGRYLAESAPNGDYIFIWGDQNRNVIEMYHGAMKYLEPLNGQVNIILETGVKGWSPEEAKKVVTETVSANNNEIAAIFAFNDKLAGACAEAVTELNVDPFPAIAGMDAELDAVKRIIDGKQGCTAFMDTKALAIAAFDQAVNFAKGKDVSHNSEMDNNSGSPIPAHLLSKQLVTKMNIDRVLIDSGYYTKEQIYG